VKLKAGLLHLVQLRFTGAELHKTVGETTECKCNSKGAEGVRIGKEKVPQWGIGHIPSNSTVSAFLVHNFMQFHVCCSVLRID